LLSINSYILLAPNYLVVLSMSNGISNHKSKRYTIPTPLSIKSDTPITITDGKITLRHEGEILLRIADTQSIEFETFESPHLGKRESTLLQIPILPPLTEPEVPEGFTPFLTTKAKSHWRQSCIYRTYKRERDLLYILFIQRNNRIRKINLGSLLNQQSIISIALKEFTREKPFYRRDLKALNMPQSLKQGQMVKACLDILTKEGFLDRTEVKVGKKRISDRYIRTAKVLP
jgi:hypothetical protein